jgi:hypothetical protein
VSFSDFGSLFRSSLSAPRSRLFACDFETLRVEEEETLDVDTVEATEIGSLVVVVVVVAVCVEAIAVVVELVVSLADGRDFEVLLVGREGSGFGSVGTSRCVPLVAVLLSPFSRSVTTNSRVFKSRASRSGLVPRDTDGVDLKLSDRPLTAGESK